MRDSLPRQLLEILEKAPRLRDAFLVGGCVRDWLLKIPNHDFDVEVYGVGYDELVEILGKWGRADLVGQSFGVVKLTVSGGETYDFSIPRRDSKIAPGHKGFEVEFDLSLTHREAAARRDFTINSLMYDPRTDSVLDFFAGQKDLRDRILRHTSEAFVEDPLRVLRGMQFAARFDLTPAEETIALCRQIKAKFGELAKERLREEWFKWAGKSIRPSAGLLFLEQTEWIEHFPELKALRATPQDPEWHPEGDVFTHTCHCCDALAGLPEWQALEEEDRIVYMLGILGHDLGKPDTTFEKIRDGRTRIVSPGHAEVGVGLTESFLARIDAPLDIRGRVAPLVLHHMAHLDPISDRSVRRLAKRLEPETIEGLSLVIAADHMGRPPRPAKAPETIQRLQARARELSLEKAAPKPILLGRHLIEKGMQPGKAMGKLLERAFEAQLDGEFTDLEEGLQWLAANGSLAETS
jgi:tRNA nucleotidyltransferase (CCA-adding enzyme)